MSTNPTYYVPLTTHYLLLATCYFLWMKFSVVRHIIVINLWCGVVVCGGVVVWWCGGVVVWCGVAVTPTGLTATFRNLPQAMRTQCTPAPPQTALHQLPDHFHTYYLAYLLPKRSSTHAAHRRDHLRRTTTSVSPTALTATFRTLTRATRA